MHFRRTHSPAASAATTDAADAGLAADLFRYYAVPVPELAFAVPQPAPSQAHVRRRWTRALVAAGAAAMVVAAVVVMPAVWGGGTHDVSAQEIYNRATDAVTNTNIAAGSPSYHLVASSSAGQGGAQVATRQETWFTDAAHVRNESSGTDGVSKVVVNGDGGLRAVTIDADGRVADADSGDASFPRSAGSLGEFLAARDETCQAASADGEGTVAGRTAYVITVSGPGCHDAKLAAAGPMTGSLKMWVDKQTFIPLRAESYDANGVVAYHYEVARLDVGVSIPPKMYTGVTPVGVAATDGTGPGDAKETTTR
jgi:hypothetical protein